MVAFNIKGDSGSTFTFNASRSYKLLYFIYAGKATQIYVRNLRIISAAVEIHHYSACMQILVYLSFFQS